MTTSQDQDTIPADEVPSLTLSNNFFEDIPGTLCDEVAEVRIIVKVKSKRYESSVSCYM